MKKFQVTYLNKTGGVILTTTVETEFGFKNVITLGDEKLKAEKLKKADIGEIRIKKVEE